MPITEERRQELLNEQKLLQERATLLQRQKSLQQQHTIQGRKKAEAFLPADTERIASLQKQLSGKLPTGKPLDPFLTRTVPFAQSEEARRRKAFKELRDIGFTRGQIASALAFEEGIKPPSKLPQSIGATAAAVGVGLATGGPDPTDIFTVPAAKRAFTGAIASGIGGVGGKSIQMALDPDAEFNFTELAKVFGEEAVLDLIGTETLAGARKLLGGTAQTAIPGAKRLSDKLAGAGKDIGIETRFLPAQFSENQLIDTIQGIGENSLVGSNTVFQFKKGQVKAAASLADNLADDIAEGATKGSFGDASNLLLDTIEDRGISHGVAAKKLYGALDIEFLESGITSNVDEIVDLSSYRKIGQELRGKIAKADDIGFSPSTLQTIDKAKNRTQNASFETAIDIRSGLLSLKRAAESKLTPEPKAIKPLADLIKEIDSSMAAAARNTTPKAEGMWRRANAFLKAGKKRFNNKAIRTLIKNIPDNPDGALTIFKNKTNIQRVKKAVGPKVFQDVKGAWIQQLIADAHKVDPSAAKGIGEPIGIKILRKFNGIGQDALDAAFTPVEQESVRDIGRILGIVQAKTGGQAGALRFVQGSALAGIVASPLVEGEVGKKVGTTSGLLLLGPAVLGKLMTKPGFNKLLSEGVKVEPGTETGVKITARLVRNVMQARREINTERLKREQEGTSKELKLQAPKGQQQRGFGGRGF